MKNYLHPHSSNDLQPLVTVIVPTIGRPDYVVDTIRSILVQTYSNIQILISDNAPYVTTASLLLAEGISDDRIDVVTRPERLGSSVHFNTCIKDARGTYVMILSDDDQITPGYVEELMQVMQSRPEVTMCLGRQIKITENDRGGMPDHLSDLPQTILDGVAFLKGSLSGELRTGVLTYISMFARRADILQAGGLGVYPDGSHAENILMFNLALRGHVALTKNLMFYRVYFSSTGLSTPFSTLLQATKAYTEDCVHLLRNAPTINDVEKTSILRSLKSNNVWMLLSRIRHVYRHRLSAVALMSCLLQVARFRLTRTNSL